MFLQRKNRFPQVLASLAFLLIASGSFFLFQDLKSFVSDRSQNLEENLVAFSQLLPLNLIESSLNNRETGSTETQELERKIQLLVSDLQIDGRITLLKAENQSTEVLYSTEAFFKRGDPYFIGEKQWLSLLSHLPTSTGLEREGSQFWIEAYSPIFGPNGDLLAIISLQSPETDFFFQLARLGAHYLFLFLILFSLASLIHFLSTKQLRLSKQRLENQLGTLVQDSQEAMLITDQDFKILNANPSAVDLLKESATDLHGRCLLNEDAEPQIIPLDQSRDSLLSKLKDQASFRFKAKIFFDDEESFYAEVRVRPFEASTKLYFLVFQKLDVQASSMEVSQLPALSLEDSEFLDPITQLPNRNFLKSVLDSENKNKSQNPSSLVFLDLDDFRYLQHLHGKPAAQGVLKKFSQILKAFFRQTDFVFCNEGDQFVVLLPGTNAKTASQLISNLHLELRKNEDPFIQSLFFSAGIAQTKTSEHPENSLNRAKQAVKKIKREGKAGIQIAEA